MVSVYHDADYLSALKQKNKLFTIFMVVTLAYAAFCIAWLIYYISLPYADPMQALPKACVYVASALYVLFIFPFMAIKFSRSRRYCKMLFYVSEGLKMEECNYFYRFREKSLQKDNIDVIGCVFATWSRKKQEWMEREAYCDPEKPLPEFGEGDLVRYVTQSNFIVQYEILERHAYDFEEYEEDEDDEDDETEEIAENQENQENQKNQQENNE